MKKTLHAAVPTTTIIASKTNDPYFVAVFRSSGKHGNKLVLPGGRVKVGKQNWLETGKTEADEELGIKNLTDIKLFCLCSDPNRDVRQVTIEKLLDGQPTPEGFPTDMDIIGHYTFDVVLTAKTDDELRPDKDEAKEAFYIDLRDFNPEDFALDHGKILSAYRNYLETGALPALDQF